MDAYGTGVPVISLDFSGRYSLQPRYLCGLMQLVFK